MSVKSKVDIDIDIEIKIEWIRVSTESYGVHYL